MSATRSIADACRFYSGGGGDVDGVGWMVAGLIEKKATASSIVAIQIIMTPITIIVKTAPISNNSPAVENIPTPDFEERMFSDFL